MTNKNNKNNKNKKNIINEKITLNHMDRIYENLDKNIIPDLEQLTSRILELLEFNERDEIKQLEKVNKVEYTTYIEWSVALSVQCWFRLRPKLS